MAMEFLAATKEGIIIYDANEIDRSGDAEGNWSSGKTADGSQLKVVGKVPSPPNAFGHAWSTDGERLASVCDEGVRIYDATKAYKMVLELPRVAPDVDGRTGGVRNVIFSPKRNFLVSYEKWDPVYPENVHVWSLEGDNVGKKLYTTTLKGYTSGALPVQVISWTPDESAAVELVSGKGLMLKAPDLSEDEGSFAVKLIAEKSAANYQISPMSAKGNSYVCIYTPESPNGVVGRIAVYDLAQPEKKPTCEMHLPAKVKEAKIMWNFDASALLVLANSDVDESGFSYFGTTYLYWMKVDSKVPSQIYGSKDGQVQDVAWSPTASEFVVICGFPGVVSMHDGKTGKVSNELGKARRNTLKWNRWGRFIAVGGFGTMAGDLDFFDRSKDETISSLRAPLTVDCAFGPDGRHFLGATVAPRMNEGNQISLYRYTGEMIFQIHYVPDHIEGRHEDTGAGARTKTQALLFAASWRPVPNSKEFEDRPASPPKAGTRRKKGLPEGPAGGDGKAPVAAYRPRGAENLSTVAAMMRGELPTPSTERWGSDGPAGPQLQPMEEWEIRKLEKQAKKDKEAKEKAEKEAIVQARKDFEKSERDDKKKLKALKEQLEQLDALKEKDWDELTEEDEQALEGEVELKAQIAELEKKVGGA